MDEKFTSLRNAENKGDEEIADKTGLFYSALSKVFTHEASINAEEIDKNGTVITL